MNRTHGSCRGSWDTYGCLFTDPETWILQRFLRYMWMLRHESGDMDLAEDPEIHMDAYIRIRRHGSCRGAWDTYECLYMDPETWILQRFLGYIWMLRHESGDRSCRGSWELPTYGCLYTDPETWNLQRILRYKDAETWIRRHGPCRDPEVYRCWDMNRRHGSCRGSWDTDPETWILQRFLRYIWMLRHESETWIRRHGTCRGSWDIKMLRHESGDVDVDLAENPWDTKMLKHESEDVDLVEDPEIHMAAELWIRQHGSCRGPWDTHGCWDMNPETWILQRSLRHKDVETWIRRCGSCSRSSLVDATTWIGDMTPAEDLEIRSVQKTQTYVL